MGRSPRPSSFSTLLLGRLPPGDAPALGEGRCDGNPGAVNLILAPPLLGMMPSPARAIDCFNSRAWRLVFAIVSMAASAGLSITWRPMIIVFPNSRQGGRQTAVSPEITTILYVWKHEQPEEG
jgi:hypothetical protein